MAAKRRSPISKVSSQSIVFLENVLWLEFCDRFLCELRICSQLFRLQTCLLQAHKDVLIARLARFAGAPQAALDPPGLPKDAKSLFGVSRWDNLAYIYIYIVCVFFSMSSVFCQNVSCVFFEHV